MLAGVEAVANVESKLRQDITPAPDADPRFGPVASEVMRYLASIAMTAAATVVAVGVDSKVTIPNLSLVFVVPVIIAGVSLGLGPSLCSAIPGALAFNFFLTEPRYSLAVDDPANIWAIGLLFVVGLIVSSVAFTSRQRAGESHVRGGKLLRWNENLILTVSPDSIGDLFGPLCRMLFAIGRSSEEPSTARFDRDAVHCAAGHAVRSHDLLRHRAVWAVERSAVAHDSGAGAGDTEPRHLQPCLSHPRSEQLREGVSALYQGVCDDDQNQRRGSSRWQSSEKSVRTRPKSHAASDGDGVERNDPHGACQCAGTWKQRSGRRLATHRASSTEGLRRHGRCAALSSRDGESHRRARRRLRLGGEEQPAGLVARCQGRHLCGRAQQGHTSHHQGCRSRPQGGPDRDRCYGQRYGQKARLSGSQGRRADHQQT